MLKNNGKTISVAKSAGFCFGVQSAVELVAGSVAAGGAVATLGPIINNTIVVDGFSKSGVRVLQDPLEARRGEKVVIRSHGATQAQLDTLAKQGAVVVDATCPFVKRIHKEVLARKAGQVVVVVGEPDHPEVTAIVSYAGERVYVVSSVEEVSALPHMASILVVAQTTTKQEVWEQICRALQGHALSIQIVDTICQATKERQQDAISLSHTVDAMLIVGDRASSNTQKLYELCSAITPSYLIGDKTQIPFASLSKAKSIGITAGASTPDEIIKEVITTMSELDNKNLDIAPTQIQTQEPIGDDNANFMAEFEKTLVSIKPGQAMVGTIVQISDGEVCVNIGYKSDGIIPRSELISDVDLADHYKVGDEIQVEVVKVNDGEGNVLLSQRNILVMKNWDALVAKFEANEYVEGIGKEVVKGGLICDVMGVRTFVPASQLAERYVEKIDQFVGQTMMLKIIEIDRAKRRMVASRKVVAMEENKSIKDRLWEKLVVGELVTGVVRRLADFGAFVDIGGMDGLVHITDLSWGHVKHPGDVLKQNQEITVRILSADRDRDRISLGLKQLASMPWDTAALNYPIGSMVEGKVVRIVTFGAFVELEPGLDGLVHISQIAQSRINKVEDILQIGQMLQVKVLDINADKKRISLSIKEAVGVDKPHDALDALPMDLSEAVLLASSETSTPGNVSSDPEAIPVGEGLEEILTPITGESSRNNLEDPTEELDLNRAALLASSDTSTPGNVSSDPEAIPVGEGLEEILTPITGESSRNDPEDLATESI